MKFEPTKQTINDLYQNPGDKIYRIPEYQRPYSWEKNNHIEFLKTIISKEVTFIGTVIYKTEDNKEKEIIDGQQRYLTVIIIIAALRDYLMEQYKLNNKYIDKEIISTIQREYIGTKKKFGDKFTYFLQVGKSARGYYKENIQKIDNSFYDDASNEVEKTEPETKEEKLILQAYKFYKSEIKKHHSKSTIEDLVTSLTDGLGDLFVVKIEIDDYLMAFEIFETVNSQGVDLSVSDLIKNQIFKNLSDNIKKAEQYWSQIIENLESLDITISPKEYLRYFWASRYEYVSDAKLYVAIKNKIDNDDSQLNWLNFLKDLLQDSKILKEFLMNSKDEWRASFKGIVSSNIYRNIKTLKAIKSKTWIVLVLSIFRKKDFFIDNKLKIQKHMENLQKFSFLYFSILGLPGNWYWIRMYKTAQMIKNTDKPGDIRNIFNNLYKDFSSKMNVNIEQFKEDFKKIQYSTKNLPILYYVLGELEKYHSKPDSAGWDEDLVNIEHFIPQQPSKWGLNKQDIKEVINLLGNLLLIPSSLNGKLGNKPLKEKLKEMGHHQDMNLLKQLVQKIKNGDWAFDKVSKDNLVCIYDRQEYLSDIGYEIWVRGLRKKMGY